MKAKWLRGDEELFEFVTHFKQLAGNPIEMSYLKQSKVRVFTQDGQMIAGYVINSAGPLRYLGMIPELYREAVRDYFDDDKATEITCIWMKRGAVTPAGRIHIYLRSMIDALSERRKWIVGGSVTPKVAEIQKRCLPRVIYQGRVTFPGSPRGEVYCSRWTQLVCLMALNVVKEGLSMIPRLFRRKNAFGRAIGERR